MHTHTHTHTHRLTGTLSLSTIPEAPPEKAEVMVEASVSSLVLM